MRKRKKAQQLEIQRYLVISTAHVTERDMERLRKKSEDFFSLLIFDEFEYGVSIYTGSKKEPMWMVAEHEEFSLDMQEMLKLALDNDCRYLKLDRDGPIVEGYAIYDW